MITRKGDNMFHICNDCQYKLDCRYSQQKFKTGQGAFCDDISHKKEQEERFMREAIEFLKVFKD